MYIIISKFCTSGARLRIKMGALYVHWCRSLHRIEVQSSDRWVEKSVSGSLLPATFSRRDRRFGGRRRRCCVSLCSSDVILDASFSTFFSLVSLKLCLLPSILFRFSIEDDRTFCSSTDSDVTTKGRRLASNERTRWRSTGSMSESLAPVASAFGLSSASLEPLRNTT